MANNPRTGRKFKVGDTVNMGDLIGYTGITGNSNYKVPHLHYGVRVNGKWVNPAPYLNATISTTITIIVTPCD